MGFVRRADVRRNYGQLRFSPRPKASKVVRKYSYIGSIDYFQNGAGRLDTRTAQGQFGIDFQNSDTMRVTYSGMYELLPVALRLTPAVSVPVGSYDYGSLAGSYGFGPQRRLLSGTATLEYGTFYEGHKTSLTLAAVRSNMPPHLSNLP